MNLEVLEGYIEVKGKYPVLVTALHGFGTDLFKDLVVIIRRNSKAYGGDLDLNYYSAVDMYTWEIAFKAAIAENTWAVLPTISKVDKPENVNLPDYNLNKPYAKLTPLWRRVRELVDEENIRVIIDLHGMKNIKKWPDICISTGNFTTTSRELVSRVMEYLRSLGFRVNVDYPFSGGAFIRFFGDPPRIEAFALELKRNLRYFGSKIPAVIRGIVRVVKEYLEEGPLKN